MFELVRKLSQRPDCQSTKNNERWEEKAERLSPTFLETIQSVAPNLACLQSLRIELDITIMGYFISNRRSPGYPEYCEDLRKRISELFRNNLARRSST